MLLMCCEPSEKKKVVEKSRTVFREADLGGRPFLSGAEATPPKLGRTMQWKVSLERPNPSL